MTIDMARLLIRVANQIPDSQDKRSLLAWADEILSDNHTVTTPPLVTSKQPSFPIPIFRHYKGTLYQGQLLKGRRVQVNGKVYPSPSSAAVHISGHPENGWRTWRYIDEAGLEHPIEALRDIV